MASPASANESTAADRIRVVLNSLVRERQALRYRGADRYVLEANRIAIVYWQQELSKRLIETSAP